MKTQGRKIFAVTIMIIMIFSIVACAGNTPTEESPLPAEDTPQSSANPILDDKTVDIEIGDVMVDFSNRGIKDEQLFEMLTSGEIPINATHFNLSSNQISDLAPLRVLNNLIELDLMYNPLTYRTVNQLRTVLPNCEIMFRSEWTVFVNGEEMEIDVMDTERGLFIPLNVMQLFRYKISYHVEMINEEGILPFVASAIKMIKLDDPNDPFSYGRMYYDDFDLYHDGSKIVVNYDRIALYPDFVEFDGVPYIFVANFFHDYDGDEAHRYGRPTIRRDDKILYLEGEIDPSYEYLPRPRPTFWRLFINGEEMPIEVIHSPEPAWDYNGNRTPNLTIYVSDFFDLYSFESEFIGLINSDVIKVNGQELALWYQADANARNRFGSYLPFMFTQPQYTRSDLESGQSNRSGNWGIQSVVVDEYEWIIHFTSTWPNPDSIFELISVADLPPLVIAPPPPPVPNIESGFVPFYRQRNDPERTNKDLADAIANGEIPADTTSLWIRLYNDNITDLSPLAELKNLQALRISNTKVSDLSPLSSMMNLQQIWIEFSPVSDLSPLVSLPSLREIHIENVSTLRDISPVSEIINLTHLGLVSTGVKDIAPIRSLTNLKTLNLRNSPVREITWLHGMDNITDIFLGGTRITEEQIKEYQNSHPGCRIDQGVPI